MATRTQIGLVALTAVAGVLTAVSYWDARRIGVEDPVRWAAVNGAIAAVGVPTYAVAGTPVGSLFIFLAAAEHHVFKRGDVVGSSDDGADAGADRADEDEATDATSDRADGGEDDDATETEFTLPGEGPPVWDEDDEGGESPS